MRVYIGPYRRWFGPYQLADALFFFVKDEDLKHDIGRFFDTGKWSRETTHNSSVPISIDDLTKISEEHESWLSRFLNWVHEKKRRKIRVHIDDYDVWSMDHTLANIVLPMLLKIQDGKQGSPFIEDIDVPENLRSTNAPPVEDGDIDAFFHDRWKWILNEMIWAFTQIVDDKDLTDFYENEELDLERLKIHEDRVRNGTTLFGKYYQNLWT